MSGIDLAFGVIDYFGNLAMETRWTHVPERRILNAPNLSIHIQRLIKKRENLYYTPSLTCETILPSVTQEFYATM